jgi:transposase
MKEKRRTRGKISKYRAMLKTKQRRRLEAVVRRRTARHWLVIRAKVVLMSAQGLQNQAISAKLSLDRQVVRRWLRRFAEGGVKALKDRPRSGRPPKIDHEVWQKAATLVVQSPTKFGLPCVRWSVRDLSRFLNQRYGWPVSRSSLSRFFRSMALKPHRVKYWLNPKDPDFDRKAAEVCKLYIAPPPKTVVLSLDEKPGVQALSRKYATRPMKRGRVARVEFEYRRNGTRNIFAAFNVLTGQILVEVTEDRTTPRVLDFLDAIVRFYRRGPIIIITDNIHTRRGEAARDWLERHPRVRFVFTPFHGSWLNQVEIWFGILSSKCLRHRSFASVQELAYAIYEFAQHWNRNMAKPFEWTYTGKVLAA